MIDVLSGNPVARALGVALLQFVWQGAALAALTALALQVLRRHSSSARYGAACLGLLSMLAAPIVTAATSSNSSGNAAHDAATRLDDGAEAGITTLPSVTASDRDNVSSSLSRFWNRDLIDRLLPVVVTVWAFGVLLLTLQLAGSWLLVERIRRAATRPLAGVSDGYLLDIAARLNVTRRLRVAVSSRVDVPTVIGWIRPLILVPSSVMAGLSPFQLQAIIAHEIAHIRRHDYVVNVLQSLVETLLFYHPAVWWVSRQIRLEREHCCDDVAAEVCGDRVAYARALASLEELRADAPRLALAANGGDLVTRIRRLLGRPLPATPQSTWTVIVLTVATVSLVFAGGRVGLATATVDPGALLGAGPSTTLGAGPSTTPGAGPSTTLGAGSSVAAPQSQGIGQAIPVAATPATPKPSPNPQADRLQVTQAEGSFHVARARNDVGALAQLLADEFVSTSQSGITRNRAGALQFYRNTRISSLSQGSMDVRVANGLAVVTGSSLEASDAGTDRLVFTRVWRRDETNSWKLVSNSQFRDPREGTPPTPPVPFSGSALAADALRIGGDIKEPRKVVDVKPIYPQIALAAQVQGIVIIELVLEEQGNVADARVLRSQPLLDQAALDAVKQWKFQPTLLNGVAVPVKMTVTVNFSLPK